MSPCERISDDDLAYHRVVVQQTRDARAALDSWSRHLSAKYGLGPADGIAEDGSLLREAARAAPPAD